jgi:hypothetical protein
MTKFYPYLRMLIVVCFTLALATMAQAQATRTWVSGVGDDANPCSRTAPCKTFAGAISKTAVDGEIDALDPGGFGAVTITKSITIDGCCMVSILASGTTAVIINITSGTDLKKTVRLRNISMNGASTGVNGINFIAGLKLYIENCQIYGFQSTAASRGIKANLGAAAAGTQLTVKDTNIENNASGIDVSATSGVIVAVMDNVRMGGMTDGLIMGTGSGGSLRNSVVTGMTGVGVKMVGGAISLESDLLNHNGTGLQPGAGTSTDLSNTGIIGNNVGIATTGGLVQSHGNNQINLNTSAGAAPSGIGQQ